MASDAPQATESEERDMDDSQIRSIRYFPVTMLSGILAFFGTGMAWEIAADLFGMPRMISKIFLGFGLGYALAVIGLYIARQIRHPASLREDLDHPRRANFLAPAPLGLLMIIEIVALQFGKATDILWILACIATVALCALIMNQWLSTRFRAEEISPAWCLPSAGLLIIPITGAPLGYHDLSWMFFAVGFILWLCLFPLILNRLLFLKPLSPVLAPDHFLLIVPPVLASIAVTRINGGYMDDFSVALLGFALLVFLFFLPRWRKFLAAPFGMPWWCCAVAFGFLATAAQQYYDQTGHWAAEILAAVMLVLTTVATVTITGLSLSAFARGRMFRAPKS